MSNRPPMPQGQPQGKAPIPGPRGPVALVIVAAAGLIATAMLSWMLGCFIELAGMYYFWPEQGVDHSRSIVEEDRGYIESAPRSILIGDTVKATRTITNWIERPYRAMRVPGWNAAAEAAAEARGRAKATLGQIVSLHLSRWLLMSMYVAQDTALRLAIAFFALPAFVLACLMGSVDGLVRRDLRRWGGGRESSFVYHHAKRWTKWALTGGFALYLTWPFGGFNPAYMVLAFSVLVAATLSTTVASFKKYL